MKIASVNGVNIYELVLLSEMDVNVTCVNFWTIGRWAAVGSYNTTVGF